MFRFVIAGTLAALVVPVTARAALTWTDVSPPALSQYDTTVRQVFSHPLDGKRLLAVFRTGVQVSSDRGLTWTTPASQPAGPFDIERVFVHPGRPGVVFTQVGAQTQVGFGFTSYSGGGLFRSADFGFTWARVQDGISAERVWSASPFASDPLDPEHVIATKRSPLACGPGCLAPAPPSDFGIVDSLDGGRTWRESASGLPPSVYTAGVEVDRVSGPTPGARMRLFFVSAFEGVFYSRDTAATWGKAAFGLDGTVDWVRQDPLRPNVLYARTPANGATQFDEGPARIFRSDDGGTTWTFIYNAENRENYFSALDTGRNPSLTIDPVRSERLWLTGLEAGIRFSADSGAHWSAMGLEAEFVPFVGYNHASVASGLALSPADPDFVYVIWKNRLMRGEIGRNTVVAAEFKWNDEERYWVSGDPGEALSQDYRAAELTRTGATFAVWQPQAAPAGATGVCRFQGNPAYGQHSRFITLQGAECEALKRSPAWVLEGADEFFAMSPANGKCAADLVAVTRFFNGRADVNHRYVSDPAVAEEMRARGWIEEGVAFCGPAM